MENANQGFLEYLYAGTYRPDLLFAEGALVDDAKVDAFVDRYVEIVSKYSPLELEKNPRIPDALMSALKQLGIFGLTIPKQYGGLGFTTTEYLRVVEAMAATDMALVLIPLAHLSIGLKGIVLFGSQEQKDQYLPRAATGELIFAYALTEPGTGSDAQHITTSATLSEDGSHYVLSGSKTYITNGGYAGGMTVFAQLDPDSRPGYMGAFIVETAWDGVKIGPDMPKMGLKVSSTTAVQLKNVRVPVANLIGGPGDGFKVAMNVLNYGRLGLGAAGAGMMKQSTTDMNKRATSRRQFGMPIRDFELIQEKLVRAQVHGFAASNMTYLTARMLEQNPLMNVAIESSHVKRYATDQAWNTLYDALQTAGGAGFIQTTPYEKRMRDARVTTIFEGTSEIHAIYPPLTVFRQVGKRIGSGGLGKTAHVLFSLRRTKLRPSSAGSDRLLSRALRVAQRGERAFKRMAVTGVLRFGREVAKREFYLRRMTRISTAVYQLVATVAALRTVPSRNTDSSCAMLEYLIAEAASAIDYNFKHHDRAVERAHREVFRTLEPASRAARTQPPATSPTENSAADRAVEAAGV